jgi:hypothetical protein
VCMHELLVQDTCTTYSSCKRSNVINNQSTNRRVRDSRQHHANQTSLYDAASFTNESACTYHGCANPVNLLSLCSRRNDWRHIADVQRVTIVCICVNRSNAVCFFFSHQRDSLFLLTLFEREPVAFSSANNIRTHYFIIRQMKILN